MEDYTPIGEEIFCRKAGQVGRKFQAFGEGKFWDADRWRFLRCHDVYRKGRIEFDLLDRLHQFTRCIEGLIAAPRGDTTRQFANRTALFIGPHHRDLMKELYQVRSDIEHLNEHKHLMARDRPTRIHLAKLEAVSELIARSCLAHILLDRALLTQFGNATAIRTFWAKPEAEMRLIWGPPLDLTGTLQGFDFDLVSDSDLGL